jgi:hypothetical protein
MIRTVIHYTEELDEILPKKYGSNMHSNIFTTTLVYLPPSSFQYTQYAKMRVRVCEIESSTFDQCLAVEVAHLRGDTRVCMCVFKTIRDYILSNGTTSYKVEFPDLQNGFVDEYYLAMHDID